MCDTKYTVFGSVLFCFPPFVLRRVFLKGLLGKGGVGGGEGCTPEKIFSRSCLINGGFFIYYVIVRGGFILQGKAKVL